MVPFDKESKTRDGKVTYNNQQMSQTSFLRGLADRSIGLSTPANDRWF